MDYLVSEQGPPSTSAIVQTLTEEHHISHHFSTAYCPWANGKVD